MQHSARSGVSDSPISPHASRQVVTALLGLHKDNGLVLFLRHDLFHQLKQPDGEGKKEIILVIMKYHWTAMFRPFHCTRNTVSAVTWLKVPTAVHPTTISLHDVKLIYDVPQVKAEK